MVATIMVLVVIIGVGVGVLAYRGRTEKGIESGITSFRRELHALAPRPDLEHLSPGPERPKDEARGMKIMPPEAEAEADADAAIEPEPAEAPAEPPTETTEATDTAERPDA